MKKLINSIFVVTLITISFMSCRKNNTGFGNTTGGGGGGTTTPSIVGHWNFIQSVTDYQVFFQGTLFTSSTQVDSAMVGDYLDLKADLSMVRNLQALGMVDSGTYTYTSPLLIMNKTDSATVTKLTTDSLSAKLTMYQNQQGFDIYITSYMTFYK